PMDAKASAPFIMIQEMLANVSTLLMFVGLAHSPLLAGKGGLNRGMPRLPSMEAMRAVSSPHTNAPAPSLIFTEKLKAEPKMFLPRNPLARASLMECFKRWTAFGYSART